MESAQSLRLDLIIRTSKRKKEAKSPQQQRDMAETSARAHGHQIVYVHDSGTDESGKTMNRKSINDAHARVRAGLTDGIILALADRIGRAPIEEAMTTVRAFCSDGKLVLADMGGQPIDLSNSVNETNVVMQLQFARQYWLATANRFLHSQRDAVKAGKWIGKAPIGFVKVAAGPDKGKLAPHPELWLIMRDCYRLTGTSGLGAGIKFMRRMVPDRDWTTAELRRVLACRGYRGELHYKGFAPNLEAHVALVTEAEWLAAQTEAQERRESGEYVLSHLVFCQCGAGLVGGVQHVRSRGYSYRRMRCATCNRCSIRADGLEGFVRDAMREVAAGWDYEEGTGAQGLDAAKDAFNAAKDSRRALVDKVDPSHDDFETYLAKADTKVETAKAEYHRLILEANEIDSMPQAAEMDDDDKLKLALRIGSRRGRFVVAYSAKGARVPVADRVRFVRN